ncbi:MAG: hypothetical protein F6K45_23135 [Kamptonema sp. SIO1D9]|nr:hypothetical protein [Kamptonema sp. SIO1D9]
MKSLTPSAIQGEIVEDSEKIWEKIENLPPVERIKLAQKFLGKDSGLTVVLGGQNVINNSFSLQLNSSTDEISEQLKNIPPEVLGELLQAIAIRIRQDS